MTNPTATDLDTFTDAERALAQAIPSVYVTQLAVARCLLRLERLERKAGFATMAKAAGETLSDAPAMLASPSLHEAWVDGMGVGYKAGTEPLWIPPACPYPKPADPSAPSKVAASLPAEPAPQPEHLFTPAVALDICRNCGNKQHDHYSGPWTPAGEFHCHKYTVQRRPEEPQHPRGVEVGGEECRDELESSWRSLRSDLDAALARVAELETERNRSTCLTHLSHHDANCADCGWAHRCNMLRIERDKLSTDNARLQGELEALATAHAEAMRLLHDAYGDSLDACSNVQAALDAANTRAERMAAVVAEVRARLNVLDAGAELFGSRERLAAALTALDAATSPVVEPGGKVT